MKLWVLAAVSLLLFGCIGGGGNATPTPTPTPPPATETPVQTPTPELTPTPGQLQSPTPTPAPKLTFNCPELSVTIKQGFGSGGIKVPDHPMREGDELQFDIIYLRLERIGVCAVLANNFPALINDSNYDSMAAAMPQHLNHAGFCGEFYVEVREPSGTLRRNVLAVENFDVDMPGAPYRLRVRTANCTTNFPIEQAIG